MRRVLVLFLLSGCGASDDGSWFVESAQRSGLAFQHVSAIEHEQLFPEIMSGGAGLADFDGDGWLDVYCVQGGDPASPGGGPRNQLYRNDGTGHFHDVSAASGSDDDGYGMGCACGDFDGDGRVDLYVTNIGPNRLYRNLGQLKFEDVTQRAGVGDPGFGTSAAFCDYDLDGDLDLFVANNLAWSPEVDQDCMGPADLPDYCHPNAYDAPQRDTLYRNDGNGRFTDVSEEAGLGSAFGNGLGVVCGDFDGNGWPDFYVANDSMANQLWLNQDGVTFIDRAMRLGCALSGSGTAEAGMGVQAIDIEGDGDLDLFVTHLRNQKNTLYLNRSDYFQDSSAGASLASSSRPYTGFGVGFVDFDQDRDLDLFVANGRVQLGFPLVLKGDPYAEENLLYTQVEPGRFEEVSPRGGVGSALVATSRAAAFGDLDNDGAMDIVIVNRDRPLHVLMNRVGGGAWVGFRVFSSPGVDAVGAQVRIRDELGEQSRWVAPAYSYCASNDPRILFGLGEARQVESVSVLWPSGAREEFGPARAGEYHTLLEGRGR